MWAGAAEPAWGTAAPATFWVALEQRGPWGHKALTESRLDPQIGRALERSCAAAGGRALLIRRPEDHRLAEDAPEIRRLYVSGGMPAGAPWLLMADVEDPAVVLDLPFELLNEADPEPVIAAIPALHRHADSVLLVCTNARRDACCAVLGRPVALEAATLRPDRVWECTHTGGHRFAATAVALPTGATLARLTTDLAVAAVDATARAELPPELLEPQHQRGLSHLSPPCQAADAAIRFAVEETDVLALTSRVVTPGPEPSDPMTIAVSRRDGREWLMRVVKEYDASTLRKNSCVTAAVPAESWRVTLTAMT